MKDLSLIIDQPWALHRPVMEALLAADVEALKDFREPQAAGAGDSGGGVIAVIPVYGVIQQRADIFMAIFGGVSVVGLTARLRAAVASPEVKAIVLDIHSPGGSVYGITELAKELRAMRQVKPVVALADSVAASAAYWLAASASEVVVTPSGEVGSVGVYAFHEDTTGADEKAGIKYTVFKSGEAKSPEGQPLNDKVAAALQARVDSAYSAFVADVADGRGVAAADVQKGYGEGAVLAAKAAKAAGMVDRIATLDEVIKLLSSPSGRRAVMGLPEGDAGEAERRLRAMAMR